MNSVNQTEEGAKRARYVLLSAATLVLIAAVLFLAIGRRGAGRAEQPGPGSLIAAAESDVSPAEEAAGAVPEEITSPSPAEVPESEVPDAAADPLAGLIGAAVPNVAGYAFQASRAGRIVCIDPGHQDHEMSGTEPNGPGSDVMKAQLTSGTQGAATGNTEYDINLRIGLILRDILRERGYTVVMTRETNDIEISNVGRALLAAECGARAFVRLHCNGSDNRSARGVVAYRPTESNPYLSADLVRESTALAEDVLDGQVSATGQPSLGLIGGDDMTGINWAQMPVTIIEMGYMSNPEEDAFLGSGDGQRLIAEGIANGIDRFFEEREADQE